MDRQVAQLAALAATHGRLREDNAAQRRIVAEYEHYCVLLENTLASLTNVPVTVVRSNYKNGRPCCTLMHHDPLTVAVPPLLNLYRRVSPEYVLLFHPHRHGGSLSILYSPHLHE